MPPRTLIEHLENLRILGKDCAYVHRRGYRTVRWSYSAVVGTSCRLARELEERGIGKGDRVLLWGENCAEWVAAFFGCLLRGAVVVPLDPSSHKEFALRITREVGARLLIASRKHASSDLQLSTLALENLRDAVARHSPAPYSAVSIEPDDPVEIIFTSGTTADPKGVVLSHRNILANLKPIQREIKRYRRAESVFHPIRLLTVLPLSHVFGQFLGIFIPSLLGGTVVFQDTLNPSEIERTCRRERISVLATVPRLLETLRAKVERDLEAAGQLERFQQQWQAAKDKHVLRRWWRFRRIRRQFGWRFWAFISGGAALDRETETFWRRLGYLVIQGYGLTETAALISVNHPARVQKGSIGLILPGSEVKLTEEGEILVRGENIAAGYWHGGKQQPVREQDGWFRTGDLGTLDAKGSLYFKGRKKNVIVTPEGMNVFPADLEAVLRRLPEVRDCVVLGWARNGNAEPAAVLLLRDPQADPGEIVSRANESLAEHQHIRRWFLWPDEDFPRTPTQKPQIQTIQAALQEQLGGKPRAAPGAGSLAELVGSITGRIPTALSPKTNLATELGLSSLERVELLSALEDRYQVDLNETRFAAATTVGELELMLRRPEGRRTDYVYPRWPRRWPLPWIRFVAYYLLVWPATLLLAYPRVRGRENIRGKRGPFLVICNHVTRADIGFVQKALPFGLRHRLAVSMEGERLRGFRNPPAELSFAGRFLARLKYALVVALFNVFPLPQQSGFRESFAFAGELVDRGYSVVVFPEGRLTQDGRVGRFQKGIGILANNLNLPVLPLRIDGLYEAKQAGRHWARPGEIRVSIGPPVEFEPDTDPARIASELEGRVAALAWPVE